MTTGRASRDDRSERERAGEAGWKDVYRSEEVAARYARKRATTRTSRRRDQREHAIVVRALERAGLAARAATGRARALDIPTGTGRFIGTLLARGLEVVAADIAASMLRRARDAAPPAQPGARGGAGPDGPHRETVRFLLADAERLPFRDASFDLVLMVRLLHHAPGARERSRLLAETARVVRDGGHVLASFFHAISFHELRDRLLGALRPFRRSRHAVTLRRLSAEARAAGLTVVEAYPELRYVKRNWFVLFRKAHADS